MSRLAVYPEAGPEAGSPAPVLETTAPTAIAALLRERGVRFEQWEASEPLSAGASQEDILAAYADDVERLKREGGYVVADVLSIAPDNPQRAELREKFLNEHTHSEDEVRFFVEGSGAFYFHIGDEVIQVVCAKGDLMSVPAGTRHWFDMGPAPSFTAIRIFTNPEGWVANFTGDPIAQSQPRFGA